MTAIPINTVRKRLLVLAATIKQGIDANNDLLSNPNDSFSPVIKIFGTKSEASTAMGIYFSHASSIGGMLNLDNMTKGSILGIYVTKLIPIRIKMNS
jgi:hypothetical protein